MISAIVLTIIKWNQTSAWTTPFWVIVWVMRPKSAFDVLRHKRSYDRDQLYLESCRAVQTLDISWKFQLVPICSIVSQGNL